MVRRGSLGSGVFRDPKSTKDETDDADAESEGETPVEAQPAKRARKGALVCARCGKKQSQELPWATTEVADKKGRVSKVPLQDACAPCFEWYTTHLSSWMSWKKFVEMNSKNEGFKAEVEAALSKSVMPFVPSKVEACTRYGLEISSHGFLLDNQDVKFLMDGKGFDELKIKPSTITDPSGKVCKVIACQDPDKPFRTFRAFSLHFDGSSKQHLPAEQQAFPSQPEHLLTALMKGRADGTIASGQQQFLPGHPRGLKTVDDMVEEWKAHQAVVGSDADDEEKDEADEPMGPAKSAEDVAPAMSVYGDGKKSKAGSKVKRLNSGRASTVGESNELDYVDESVGQALPPRHWIEKITLPAVMNGKNFGKEIGFANQLLERLDSAKKLMAAKILRRHLKHVEVASKLTTSSIKTMPRQELIPLVTQLHNEAEELDWPSSIKSALLGARCTHCTEQCSWQNHDNIAELFDCLIFWTVDEEASEFNPLAPKLSQLDGVEADRLKTFHDCLFKDLLVKLISEGEGKASDVLALCSGLLPLFEGLAEQSGVCLTEKMEGAIGETCSVLRALTAALDETYLEDVTDDVKCIMSAKKKTVILQSIKVALTDNEFYEKLVLEVKKHGPAVVQYGFDVKTMEGTLEEMPLDGSMATVEKILEYTELLQTWLPSFRPGALKSLEQKMPQCILTAWAAVQWDNVDAEQHNKLEKLVQLACTIWPANGHLQKKKDELTCWSSDRAVKQHANQFMQFLLNQSGLPKPECALIFEKLSTNTFDLNLELADENAVVTLVQKLVPCTLASWGQEDVQQHLDTAQLLVELLVAPHNPQKVSFVQSCIKLSLHGVQVAQQAKALGQQPHMHIEKDANFQLTSELIRANEAFKIVLSSVDPDKNEAMFTPLHPWGLSMDKKIAAISKAASTKATENMEKAMAALKPLASGGVEGKSWLDGFKGPDGDWNKLKLHAEKTLATLDKSHFQVLIKNLTEAKQYAEEVAGVFSSQLSTVDAETMLTIANKTWYQYVLFKALVKEYNDNQSMRKVVVAIKADIVRDGYVEKDFPKAMWTKAAAAAKFKAG